MFLYENYGISDNHHSFNDLIKYLKDSSRFEKFNPGKNIPYSISCEILNTGHRQTYVDMDDNGKALKKPYYKDTPEQTVDVLYTFGNNGPGLTNELLAIGEDIHHWCKYYNIGLLNDKTFIDEPDDLYYLEVSFLERKKVLSEGAAGYKPEDSDEYWDVVNDLFKRVLTHMVDTLNEYINKVLKDKTLNQYYCSIYTYLGMINNFIAAKKLITLYKGDHNDLTRKLIKTYEKGYKVLSEDKDNIMGWDHFNEYKKQLKKTRDQFYQILLKNYDGLIKKEDIKEILNEKIKFDFNKKLYESIEEANAYKCQRLNIRKDLEINTHKITKDQEKEVVKYLLKNHGYIADVILKWHDDTAYYDHYCNIRRVSSLSDPLRKCFYNQSESQLDIIPLNYTLFDALCEFSYHDNFPTLKGLDTAPGDGIVDMCETYIEKNYPELVRHYLGVYCQ